MSSHIQSDIIWPQFPATTIRPRKFRMLLQMSKENRGEGQKMDHERISVTQSQLRQQIQALLVGSGKGSVCPFTEKGDAGLPHPHLKVLSQPRFPRGPERCWASPEVSQQPAELFPWSPSSFLPSWERARPRWWVGNTWKTKKQPLPRRRCSSLFYCLN